MPDDEDYNLPDDWSLDAPFSQGEGYSLDDMATEYGWQDWRDVIAPAGDYTDDMVRPGVYFSADDALSEAYNVGILDFTRIVFGGYEDMYGDTVEIWYLVVDSDSGQGT